MWSFPSQLADLGLELSPVVVDRDGLDGSETVRSGAFRLEVVLVCPSDTICLKPPPAGGVVGDGAVFCALEQEVAFVVCNNE